MTKNASITLNVLQGHGSQGHGYSRRIAQSANRRARNKLYVERGA